MTKSERFRVAVLCLLVGWFYLWTVRSTGAEWVREEHRRDYYNLLIDGWIEGQLHMKVEVPAELLALKNPYDPGERRPGLGLHDASFYRGKYYVYFGVAPAVTLMLPWRVVTGADMPLPYAVLIFVYGGFLASVALFGAVRRRYFPESGWLVHTLGVLTLGLAGAGLVLLRRPDMWELPIGGGYCFAMLALLGVWRSAHAATPAGRRRWLAGAATLLGLAIASRPTYLFALPMFAAPWVLGWRLEGRLPWRDMMASVVPLALVGAAMAWHNWARFDHPLQFGQAYQFSLDYESKLPHFAPSYVPFNVNAHFLAPAEWGRYFPFIRPGKLGEAPIGYTIHRGDVYGVLASYPLAGLALLAPLALRRRLDGERRALGAWLGATALLCGGAAAVMLSFFSCLSRYQVDFMPAFMVLATVGLLAAERAVRGAWRWPAGLAAGLAGTYGAAFGVLFSFQFDGMLRENNAALADELARTFNRVPAWFERLGGVNFGPVELTVRWATLPAGGEETVARIGRGPQEDRVIVRHLGGGRAQFGLAPAGAAERMGRPVALAAGQAHRVRVTLASVYPPRAHPFFAGWRPEEIRATLRRAEIAVDGETVLRDYLRLERAGTGEVRLERAEAWRRLPPERGAPSAENPLAGGGATLRLQVRFKAQAAGTREPLVVTGRTGAGEIFAVEHLAGGEVRFVLDSWGQPMRASPPRKIDFAAVHDLEVTMAALATVDDATLLSGGRAGPLRVRLDGATVWEDHTDYHAAEHAEVYVGRNPIGGTSCGPVFAGDVLAAERVRRE